MDVKGKTEIVEAERCYKRGLAHVSLSSIALVFVVLIAAAGWISKGNTMLGRPFIAISVLAFLALIGTMRGGGFWMTEAYRVLWDLTQPLQSDELEARQMIFHHKVFIGAFYPSSEVRERALVKAAAQILDAHTANVQLRERGMGAVIPMQKDAEDHATATKRHFETLALQREEAVKRALDKFYELRDAIRAHGYATHDSWKPYAGVAALQTLSEARREQGLDGFPTQPGEGDDSLPVLVEGRSEPPGQ